MQVLKDEVRQRILKSSRKEFMKCGFEKASMRTISNNAGMTVGNLYRYYKNKEDLFGAIIDVLHKKIKNLKSELPKDPEVRLNTLLESIKELQETHGVEWLILVDGSEGTRFHKAVDDVCNVLRDTLKAILEKKRRKPEMATPVASSVIHGLSTILRSQKSGSSELAAEFLNYMLADFTKRV